MWFSRPLKLGPGPGYEAGQLHDSLSDLLCKEVGPGDVEDDRVDRALL